MKPINSKIDKKAVLRKAQSYCIYQERSKKEVLDKLYQWHVEPEDAESIITQLITDDFINEKHFAIHYSSGKFRIKKWGKEKIKFELNKKGITNDYINNALSEIDEKEYLQTLEEIITKKIKTIKDTDSYTIKAKIANYAISKGFEFDFVWNILKNKDKI